MCAEVIVTDSHRESNSPSNPNKRGYRRVKQAAYQRGYDAGTKYAHANPQNPYGRFDFRKMWQLGYDAALAAQRTDAARAESEGTA